MRLEWTEIKSVFSQVGNYLTSTPVMLVTLAIFGGLIGAYYGTLPGVSYHFAQNMAPDIVSAACGEGWRYPEFIEETFRDFIQGRVKQFDCETLEIPNSLEGPLPFTTSHGYLYSVVVWVWRTLGVDYNNLVWVTASMSALYAAGLYLLSREFFPKWISVIAVVILLFSPMASFYFLHLRSFSKVVFITWGIYLFVKFYRETRFRNLLIFGFMIGIFVGIGVGFRADTALILIIGIPAALICSNLKLLAMRGLGISIAVATFSIISQPLQQQSTNGSIAGIYLVQGLSSNFQESLGLGTSTYGLGWKYSDELTLSAVAAAFRPDTPDWDETEIEIGKARGYSRSMTLSWRYVMDFSPLFVGDFAARALKSAFLVVAMPSQINLEGFLPKRGPKFTHFLRSIYDDVNPKVWFFLCWVGLLLFCYQLIEPKKVGGWPIMFFVCAFATTPGLQFAARHSYHLEFISTFSLLTILSIIARLPRTPLAMPNLRILALPAIVLTALSVYFGMALFQSYQLTSQFSQLLTLERKTVGELSLNGLDTHEVDIPIPNKHTELVNGLPDSLTKDIPWRGYHWEVRAAAERYLVTMSNCAAGTYYINTVYAKTPNNWQAFDHSFEVKISEDGSNSTDPTKFVFSGFYRPSQYLQALQFETETAQPNCTIQINMLERGTSLPTVFHGVLPTGWQDDWFFYTLW